MNTITTTPLNGAAVMAGHHPLLVLEGVPCRFCDGGPPTMTEGSCSVCGSPDSELVAPSVSGRVQLATNDEDTSISGDHWNQVRWNADRTSKALWTGGCKFPLKPNAILGTVNVDVVVPVVPLEPNEDEWRRYAGERRCILFAAGELWMWSDDGDPASNQNLSHALPFISDELVGKYAAIVSDPQELKKMKR
jgi:hypothetical protein